jgi:hypothetical protein
MVLGYRDYPQFLEVDSYKRLSGNIYATVLCKDGGPVSVRAVFLNAIGLYGDGTTMSGNVAIG